MTTCEGVKVSYYFEGQYEVRNVVGSSDDGGSKAQFWYIHSIFKDACKKLPYFIHMQLYSYIRIYVGRASFYCKSIGIGVTGQVSYILALHETFARKTYMYMYSCIPYVHLH